MCVSTFLEPVGVTTSSLGHAFQTDSAATTMTFRATAVHQCWRLCIGRFGRADRKLKLSKTTSHVCSKPSKTGIDVSESARSPHQCYPPFHQQLYRLRENRWWGPKFVVDCHMSESELVIRLEVIRNWWVYWFFYRSSYLANEDLVSRTLAPSSAIIQSLRRPVIVWRTAEEYRLVRSWRDNPNT